MKNIKSKINDHVEYENARVLDDARVFDDVRVLNGNQVYGNATVYEYSEICEDGKKFCEVNSFVNYFLDRLDEEFIPVPMKLDAIYSFIRGGIVPKNIHEIFKPLVIENIIGYALDRYYLLQEDIIFLCDGKKYNTLRKEEISKKIIIDSDVEKFLDSLNSQLKDIEGNILGKKIKNQIEFMQQEFYQMFRDSMK